MYRALRDALLVAKCSRLAVPVASRSPLRRLPLLLQHSGPTFAAFSLSRQQFGRNLHLPEKLQQSRRQQDDEQEGKNEEEEEQQSDTHSTFSHWILFAVATAPIAASTFISLSSCAPSAPPPDYSVFEIHDPPPPPPPTPLMSDRLPQRS